MSEGDRDPESFDTEVVAQEEEPSSSSAGGWGAVRVSASARERKQVSALGGEQQLRKKKALYADMDPDDRASKEIPDALHELSVDDKVLFYKERECLLLLLEARKVLASMILIKEKETEKLWEKRRADDLSKKQQTGKMNIQEIQNMLQSSPEEDDFDIVSEIQELKKQLILAVRQNHKLERDLAKLDKRIALLIKNRTSLQDVIAASKGLRSQKKNKLDETSLDPKKLDHYQDLFYLLQTEPKYLARCIYVINPQQLDSFLDTVILTLFGDSFSPREEFLQLSLFQLAIEKEISVVKSVGDFIGGKSETVVPKMVVIYNKRKQGIDYLKTILKPLLEEFILNTDIIELNPLTVYQAMANEHALKTGNRSEIDPNMTAAQAAERPEIQQIISKRLILVEESCQKFVDRILRSLDQLPYGLRWLCKQIKQLCLKQIPETTEDDFLKVIVYFVYYRFINLAIVTPDSYHITDDDLPGYALKNLVVISKVLQNLFNLRRFDPEKPGEKFLVPLNNFIQKNEQSIKYYVNSVVQVEDPEDKLQVNKYLELAQKTKPVIVISLGEIFKTHALLFENIDNLAPEKDNPLRIILNDLGPCETQLSEDEEERELQLTLTNRFKVDMEEEAEHARLYTDTKELVIPILRMVPAQASIHRLNLMDVLEAGIRFATETNNKVLQTQINKILENLGRLEAASIVTKEDDYESFVHDVALEVANRTTIRETQRKEVARLKGTLENLLTHQHFLDESIASYQDYLKSCKERQYMVAAAKKRKKKGAFQEGYKLAPIKFKYKDLMKKGVIINSEVPAFTRGKTSFIISSEMAGVFDVAAKVAGVIVDKVQLDLDNLLEMHYNNITRLELDNITLDVAMTIHLINKNFLS